MSRSTFIAPEDLEKFHVRDVYDQIAPHFVGSRHKAWPKVEAFLRSLPAGSFVADVGCGTGRYLGLAQNSVTIGSDRCMKFCEIAKKKGYSVVTCDNQCLPFKNESFDAVVSIGVIHHFASAKRRIKAIQELFRVLRPGGRMLVYVWAFEQNERKFDGQDVLVPYTHHQRNKARKRSQSIPSLPRQKSLSDVRGSSHERSVHTWHSRRAVSLDDSSRRESQLPKTPLGPGKELLAEHNGKDFLVKDSGEELFPGHGGKNFMSSDSDFSQSTLQVRHNVAKYDMLQHIRNGGKISGFEQENGLQETPVSKLRKFFVNVLEKLFHDKENEGGKCNRKEEELRGDKISVDDGSDFHTKLANLTSYFSSDNREKYFKGDLFSLVTKRLLNNKEDLCLSNVAEDSFDPSETSQDFLLTTKDSQGVRNAAPDSDVVVLMAQTENTVPCGERNSEVNGISLSVVARLMESLASSSDVDSDSSSSSDCLTSDASAADDWDRVGAAVVDPSNQAFAHTAFECRDTSHSSSTEDSLSSSSSSLSSSASLSSEESLPCTKSKSKLFQRYYHVFRSGELVRLVQEGIPRAVVLEEYCDHGNWAVTVLKAET